MQRTGRISAMSGSARLRHDQAANPLPTTNALVTGSIPGFGPVDRRDKAVEGFVAYVGRYSGDRVVHPVELSLFPTWVESDQERAVQLAGTG
jgi:hypothetical protein